MNRIFKIKLFPYLALLSLFFWPNKVFAGGLELYELGTPGLGNAGAGEAARAQDASTLFTNPAGMTQLKKSEILVGVQPLYGDAHFDRSEETTTEGSASGNPIGFLPGTSFFYVNSISDDLKAGIGAFSYFGLPLDFDNNWSGRYYTQESTLLGLTLMPSVAYAVSDEFSVGVGLNAMYGYMHQQVAVNTIPRDLQDGRVEVEDGDWGFGADVGLMYNPTPHTRIGVRYLSAVDLDFSDTPEINGLGPIGSQVIPGSRSLDLGMEVPSEVMLGVYHELNDTWAVLGSTGWQDWSKFGRVDIGISESNFDTTTTAINTKDTWHVGAGVQYKLCTDWLLSTGLSYDSSMIDDKDRPITLPVGEAWRWGLGAQYSITEDTTLGMAYELIDAGDMPVDQERGPLAGRIAGSYNDTYMHYWAFSLQVKLG